MCNNCDVKLTFDCTQKIRTWVTALSYEIFSIFNHIAQIFETWTCDMESKRNFLFQFYFVPEISLSSVSAIKCSVVYKPVARIGQAVSLKSAKRQRWLGKVKMIKLTGIGSDHLFAIFKFKRCCKFEVVLLKFRLKNQSLSFLSSFYRWPFSK